MHICGNRMNGVAQIWTWTLALFIKKSVDNFNFPNVFRVLGWKKSSHIFSQKFQRENLSVDKGPLKSSLYAKFVNGGPRSKINSVQRFLELFINPVAIGNFKRVYWTFLHIFFWTRLMSTDAIANFWWPYPAYRMVRSKE